MAEVQKYECLYNKFCREYRNRELRNACWQKVAEKFGMTPMDAEKKFRNIRTAYGRFLKKKRTTPCRSGPGQDFVPFAFENCEWLALHIIHRGFDGTTTNENIIQQNDSGSEDESSPVTMSNIEFLNFSGDYNDVSSPSHTNDNINEDISETPEAVEAKSTPKEVQTTSSNGAATSNKVTFDVKGEHSKRLISYVQNNTQPTEVDFPSTASLISKDLIREPTASKSAIIPQYLKRTFSEMEDEDDLYCRSLIPRLKRLTPQAKAYVRIQMEQLLFHAEYSGEMPQIGAPFGFHFNEKTLSKRTSLLNGGTTELGGNGRKPTASKVAKTDNN